MLVISYPVTRKRSFHFGSYAHKLSRVLFSFDSPLIFFNFDGSMCSIVHFASYTRIFIRDQSNLSVLLEQRETHRVALKRLPVSVSFEIELLFPRGGGNDREGSFQSHVKLALETIRNLFQDRFEDSAQGWKTCCIVVSSSIDGKARHISRCIDESTMRRISSSTYRI